MPKEPGVGLAGGFTIITAILSDAVALVRGDRFLTSGDTPANLTEWGFKESRSQDLSHNYGTILGEKLLNRHLPSCFPLEWLGTVFPFSTPAENQVSLPKKVLEKYSSQAPSC
eukprot:Phypoly_transcript_21202.p1 GENE.Phypoly_transcript_21202~~Phypoly_transcript_21202.p1  ORF type:complete len:113 (+),score=14.41 Phypoly_transcript_21202:282-620(+)